MRSPITKIEEGFFRATICQDTERENPREWSNLGTMVCAHRRYKLGDEQESSPLAVVRNIADSCCPSRLVKAIMNRLEDYSESEERAALTALVKKNAVILPLYLYDHSGVTMKTSPFHDVWDSGQVGFIYCSKARARMECGKMRAAERDDKVASILEAEVKAYDQYLTGDVWTYLIERMIPKIESEVNTDDEDSFYAVHEDSCCGFFGANPDTNGMIENVKDEFKPLLREAFKRLSQFLV